MLILAALAILLTPYLHSQLFEKKDSSRTGTATINTRYMSEITGIDTPEDMRRQYERHPEAYKLMINDDLAVIFAYPDPDIRWVGMVFLHHLPSVSEVALDYDGNVIFEQISAPSIQERIDDLLNEDTFVDRLQNRMNEIWELKSPGAGVLGLVNSLEAKGHLVDFLGGRPQTLFDAAMYLIEINGQDIRLYEFDDEVARKNVSDNISPDGYELKEQAGESTTIIHIEYLDQPNYWAKGCLLVQYLGTDQAILKLLTNELGEPITPHSKVSR